MAQRTDPTAVQTLLGVNYDASRCPDLQQFIDAASPVIDAVSECITEDEGTVSSAQLEVWERWLSAHYYQALDPGYSERRTGRASGKHNNTKEHDHPLSGTYYGKGLLSMDTTGCLASVTANQTIQVAWAGLPKSEQTEYTDRD